MRPFLNGFDDAMVSVGGSSTPPSLVAGARSPLVVPAKTRLPDAKITSGLSVRGSTTTSPRIPCALRTSPTIAYSDAGIAADSARLGGRFVRFFADRNGGRLARAAHAQLMALLEDSGAPKERANGVGRLGAEVEPVVGAGLVDLERTLSFTGSVLADDLDELPVARTLRVSDENTIERGIFPPDAAEANLYHEYCSLEVGFGGDFGLRPGSSRRRRIRRAPGRTGPRNLMGSALVTHCRRIKKDQVPGVSNTGLRCGFRTQ